LLGPTLTAASTLSATEKPPLDRCRAQSRTDPRAVKRDFHAGCVGRVRVLLMKSRSVKEPARRSQWLGSLKMLRSFHKRPEYLQALDRVKEWTRVADDLPPAWLKNALVAVEGEGLECC